MMGSLGCKEPKQRLPGEDDPVPTGRDSSDDDKNDDDQGKNKDKETDKKANDHHQDKTAPVDLAQLPLAQSVVSPKSVDSAETETTQKQGVNGTAKKPEGRKTTFSTPSSSESEDEDENENEDENNPPHTNPNPQSDIPIGYPPHLSQHHMGNAPWPTPYPVQYHPHIPVFHQAAGAGAGCPVSPVPPGTNVDSKAKHYQAKQNSNRNQNQNAVKNHQHMLNLNRRLLTKIRELTARCAVSETAHLECQRLQHQMNNSSTKFAAAVQQLQEKIAFLEKEKSEEFKKHANAAVQKFNNSSHCFPTLNEFKDKYDFAFTQTLSKWCEELMDMWKAHPLGSMETDMLFYIRFRLLARQVIREIDICVGAYMQTQLKEGMMALLKTFGLKPNEEIDLSPSEPHNPRLAPFWSQVRELLRGEYKPDKWPVLEHSDALTKTVLAAVMHYIEGKGNELFFKTALADERTKSTRNAFFTQVMDIVWCGFLTPKDNVRLSYSSKLVTMTDYFDERQFACEMTCDDRLYMYTPALVTYSLDATGNQWEWNVMKKGIATRLCLKDSILLAGEDIPAGFSALKAYADEWIPRLNGVGLITPATVSSKTASETVATIVKEKEKKTRG